MSDYFWNKFAEESTAQFQPSLDAVYKGLGIDHHKYKPGDKAQVTYGQMWLCPNGTVYTIKEGEVLVIKNKSDTLPDYYTFYHESQKHVDALIYAGNLKPDSLDIQHKCYCPRDTILYRGCQCKGV